MNPDSDTQGVHGQEPADRTLDFLLSPSEWRVILALYAVEAPATPEAVTEAMQAPRLPRNAVEVLLERLARRGFISPGPDGTWQPGGTSLQELLRPQIEAFFKTYLVGVPQGFDVLRKVLDEWRPTV